MKAILDTAQINRCKDPVGYIKAWYEMTGETLATPLPTMTITLDKNIGPWLEGLFKKIVVSVDSEQDLDDIYSQAKAAGLPCSLIVDSGLTEFNGVPTKTCVAVGPGPDGLVDSITGGLKLL